MRLRGSVGLLAHTLLSMSVKTVGGSRPQSHGVEMLFSMRCLLLGHDDWLVRSPGGSGCGATTASARPQDGRSPGIDASRLAREVTEPSKIHSPSQLEMWSMPKRPSRPIPLLTLRRRRRPAILQ